MEIIQCLVAILIVMILFGLFILSIATHDLSEKSDKNLEQAQKTLERINEKLDKHFEKTKP